MTLLLLWLAASGPAPAAAEPRAALIEAYVSRHREEVCGTHWVDNPTHAQCIASLRREAERAIGAGQPQAPAPR